MAISVITSANAGELKKIDITDSKPASITVSITANGDLSGSVKVVDSSYTPPLNMIEASNFVATIPTGDVSTSADVPVKFTQKGVVHKAMVTGSSSTTARKKMTVDYTNNAVVGVTLPDHSLAQGFRKTEFDNNRVISKIGGASFKLKDSTADYFTAGNDIAVSATGGYGSAGVLSSNGIGTSAIAINESGYLSYCTTLNHGAAITSNTSTGSPYYTVNAQLASGVASFALTRVANYYWAICLNTWASTSSFYVTAVNAAVGNTIFSTTGNYRQPATTLLIHTDGVVNSVNIGHLLSEWGGASYFPLPTEDGNMILLRVVANAIDGSTITVSKVDGKYKRVFAVPCDLGLVYTRSDGTFALINATGLVGDYTPDTSIYFDTNNLTNYTSYAKYKHLPVIYSRVFLQNSENHIVGNKYFKDGNILTLVDDASFNTLSVLTSDDDYLDKSLELSSGARCDYTQVVLGENKSLLINCNADTQIQVFGFEE